MTDSNADYYENDDCYEDDGSELVEDEDIVDLEDDDDPCEDLDQRMKRLGMISALLRTSTKVSPNGLMVLHRGLSKKDETRRQIS